MNIEQWPVDRLRPYEANPRRNDQAVEKVARSIREFGFNQPIVVDKAGVIVVGHTRWKAARTLGLDKVPVWVAGHLTPQQAAQYRLADNRVGEEAEWDDERLVAELEALRAMDADLTATGFDENELASLLAREMGEAKGDDESRLIEPPANPVTKPGDVWRLGEHRIMCGDATDGEAVARLFAGEVPQIMVTDPPYGVEYDPKWRAEAGWSGDRRGGDVDNDGRADWAEAWAHFPGDVAYVWHGSLAMAVVVDSLTKANMEPRSQIVWTKQHFAISRGHYHWQHETCLYVVRRGRKAHWAGGRKQTTVWQIANLGAFGGDRSAADGETPHGTQKPVECMARPLRNHGQTGWCVYDPFLGSGTTVIAAMETERRCIGMEVDPAYCDVIVERWQAFSNGKATRDKA